MIYKRVLLLFTHNTIDNIKTISEQKEKLRCNNLQWTFRDFNNRGKNLRVEILYSGNIKFLLINENMKGHFKFLFTSFCISADSRRGKCCKSWLSECLSGRRVISYFEKFIGSSI